MKRTPHADFLNANYVSLIFDVSVSVGQLCTWYLCCSRSLFCSALLLPALPAHCWGWEAISFHVQLCIRCHAVASGEAQCCFLSFRSPLSGHSPLVTLKLTPASVNECIQRWVSYLHPDRLNTPPPLGSQHQSSPMAHDSLLSSCTQARANTPRRTARPCTWLFI